MQIHWFTFISQIINFIILVLLLKHFLYGPITKAMNKREERIRSRLDEAKNKRREAEQEAGNYAKKTEELEEKKERMMSEAREEAESRKQDMIHKGREEVEKLKTGWRNAVEREKDNFLKNLRRRSGEEIYRAMRKALSDLADEELESQIISVFLKRLKTMDEDETKQMTEALEEKENKIIVRSSFQIPEGQEKDIRESVKDKISSNPDVEFERDRNLICGIEIRAGGKKISWNLEDYLSRLEENISKSMSVGEQTKKKKAEKEKTEDKDDEEGGE